MIPLTVLAVAAITGAPQVVLGGNVSEAAAGHALRHLSCYA